MLPSGRTLKAETDFNRVKKLGKANHSISFVLIIHNRNDDKPSRFGFVVSKNIDKLAVHRNRVNRALKEAVRQTMMDLPDSLDMLFIAKEPILSLTTEKIMKEVKEYLINRNFDF